MVQSEIFNSFVFLVSNNTHFQQLIAIQQWPLANERDIILVNFGLHDVAFSKIDDYSVLLHNILYKIVKVLHQLSRPS